MTAIGPMGWRSFEQSMHYRMLIMNPYRYRQHRPARLQEKAIQDALFKQATKILLSAFLLLSFCALCNSFFQ